MAKINNRHSIRLPDHDYTQPGAYFVTLVTCKRECLFGEITDGRMELSPLGQIAEEQWLRLTVRFSNWATDTFQIMPNHLHGVLNKCDPAVQGAQRSINYVWSESAALRPAPDIKGKSLPGVLEGRRQGAASPDRPGAPEGSLRPYPNHIAADSLGAVVRAYKSAVSFRFQQTLVSPGKPLWQRNYYEHIIRDDDDLDRIRHYILENPLRWSEDEENPA